MLYLLSAYYLPSLCNKPTLFDLNLRGVLWSSIISIPILPNSKLSLRKAKSLAWDSTANEQEIWVQKSAISASEMCAPFPTYYL